MKTHVVFFSFWNLYFFSCWYPWHSLTGFFYSSERHQYDVENLTMCSACAKWIDFGSMVALYIVFLHTYLHKNDFVLWIVIYMYNYRVFIYLYSQKTDKSSSADYNKKLMWQNYCTVIHYAFTNMHNQPIHTKYIHSDLVSPQFSLLY